MNECYMPFILDLGSDTLVCCIEVNAHIVKLFPPRGMTLSFFFLSATATIEFQGELSLWELNTTGWGNLRVSTEIAVCLENGTR